jgi:hypothetical protein
VLSSAHHSWINFCFTAVKRIGVENCHENCRHLKMTILTSIVYGPDQPAQRTQFLETAQADIASHTNDQIDLIYTEKKLKKYE